MKDIEKIKAENLAMKAEIVANGGSINISDGLSPEVENEFLKHILEIEREPDTRIGDLLPEFRPANELTDEEVKTELNRLTSVLEEKRIFLEVPAHMAYRFLTEEIINELITVPMSKNSHLHLDGCSGWCPDCFVVDYCESVWETWTKEELERKRGEIIQTS